MPSSETIYVVSRFNPQRPQLFNNFSGLLCNQIKDDVNETGTDRLELMSWLIHPLVAVAGQEKQQNN
jgi:hypothetical protein